jgi:CRISPR-associated protein Cas1
METLYITKDAKLTREDATLVVRQNGAPKRRFPVNTLRHVVITGEAGLTTSLLGLLGRGDVRVTVLDWHGNVTGSFEPFGAPAAGVVRKAQARHTLDGKLRLELAKEFVLGAMANIRANLRYRAYRGTLGLEPVLARMEKLEQSAKDAPSVEALMGAEGNVRASYYEAWPLIDKRLIFGPRRRRPPNNPLNCLISWFNGLLYSATRHEIAKTHLDNALSFLHAATEARHSLALDLSEPFKPVIVDTLIFELILRDRVGEDWFHQEENVCRLSEAGRRATLEAWVAKLEAEQDERPSFRTLIRTEALAIERHLLGMAPYRAFRRKV